MVSENQLHIQGNWDNDYTRIVTVEGSPPRKETAKGILITGFTRPDGRKITPAKID